LYYIYEKRRKQAVAKWEDLGKPNPYVKKDPVKRKINLLKRPYKHSCQVYPAFFLINLSFPNESNVFEPAMTKDAIKIYEGQGGDYHAINTTFLQTSGILEQAISYAENGTNMKNLKQVLKVPKNLLSNIKKNKKRFTFITNGVKAFSRMDYYDEKKGDFVNAIDFESGGLHQNMILIDNKKKTVGYFEPHGIDEANPDLLNFIKKNIAKPLGYKFIENKENEPDENDLLLGDILNGNEIKKLIKSIKKNDKFKNDFKTQGDINLFSGRGIQFLENYGDSIYFEGLCQIWSLHFNLLRLQSPNKKIQTVYNEWFKKLDYDIEKIRVYFYDLINKIHDTLDLILGDNYNTTMTIEQMVKKIKTYLNNHKVF